MLISAILSGVASCFWVYFSILVFIAIAADIFCFKKVKDSKTKISDLIKNGKCLLSQDQINLYKQLVANDVVCDEKIGYFAERQEGEQKTFEISKVRRDMFNHEKK